MAERQSFPEPIISSTVEQRRQARRLALRVAAIYAAVAGAWIAFTDYLLVKFVAVITDPSLPEEVRITLERERNQIGGTIKGWGFVLITSTMLYFLVRSYIRSVQRAETALQQENVRVAKEYRFLFDNNPLPMWVYDPEDLAIYAVNDAAVASYGYSREEFLQLTIADIRPPEDAEKLREHVARIRDQRSVTGVWKHRKRNGKLIDVEVTSHPIQFSNRMMRLIVAADVTSRLETQRAVEQARLELEHRVHQRTEDLSRSNQKLLDEILQRQRIEEELRQAKQAADAANQAKSVFVANTTHELRTPLTSILGYSDLLADESLPAEVRANHLGVLRTNAQQLQVLIDDLLDLARIEAGKLSLALSDVDPRQLVQEVLVQLLPRARERGLVLAVEVVEPIAATIRTDAARVRQILLNLASNALKFTTSGRVTIRVHGGPGEEGGDGWLVFEVRDTGIGIAPDQLVRIFEPFYQTDQGASRQFGGTGLGLPISRQLAQRLGGNITVSSEPGKGSCFSLMLPVGLVGEGGSEPAAAAARPAAVLRGRILLAEDNANVRWLVEEYLRRAGAEVTSVDSGLRALEAIRKGGEPFGLMLLDINMPGMDGRQCAAALRGQGYRGPILALTAHAATAAGVRASLAGFDAIITKPIDTRTFIPTLVRHLAVGGGAGGAESP
jgi:PAS domain S-box-containing protein